MRYIYRCAKCGGSVSKPQVAMSKEKKEGNSRGERLHGLHGWKCQACGPTSVTRSQAPKES